MAVTRLSLSGVPGRGYSFAPKTPASGDHAGAFTALSVVGLPGARQSFAAKDPAASPTGPHTGTFTALSVIGVPGGIRAFSAKSAAEEPAPATSYGGTRTWFTSLYAEREKAKRDDRDMLDILQMVIASGVLD